VSIYNEGSRRYQDRFDTRRLADRLEERFLARATIDESDRDFIEGCDMFFIATADAAGRSARTRAASPASCESSTSGRSCFRTTTGTACT
jgi:hypothetical protein